MFEELEVRSPKSSATDSDDYHTEHAGIIMKSKAKEFREQIGEEVEGFPVECLDSIDEKHNDEPDSDSEDDYKTQELRDMWKLNKAKMEASIIKKQITELK